MKLIKEERNERGIYIKTDKFEGFIFNSSYGLPWNLSDAYRDYKLWDPDIKDVEIAEGLSRSYIEKYKNDKQAEKVRISGILDNFNQFKRQYYGLINKDGNKVILIDYFRDRVATASKVDDWIGNSIWLHDGAMNLWDIFSMKVNLTQQKCYDLELFTKWYQKHDNNKKPELSGLPLQLTIEAGTMFNAVSIPEIINIRPQVKNISDKTIDPTQYLPVAERRLIFENEKDQVCELAYTGPFNEIIPTQLRPNESCNLYTYSISFDIDISLPSLEFSFPGGIKPKNYNVQLKKGDNYSFIGKHKIYLKVRDLISNTATIDPDKYLKNIGNKEKLDSDSNKELSNLPQLRFVRKVGANDKEIIIEFTDGKIGRILAGSKWDSEDWSYFQEAANESIAKKEPVEVTLEQNGEITHMLGAIHASPVSDFMEYDKERMQARFLLNQAIFYLRKDHPNFEKLSNVLREAIKDGSLVWWATGIPTVTTITDVIRAGNPRKIKESNKENYIEPIPPNEPKEANLEKGKTDEQATERFISIVKKISAARTMDEIRDLFQGFFITTVESKTCKKYFNDTDPMFKEISIQCEPRTTSIMLQLQYDDPRIVIDADKVLDTFAGENRLTSTGATSVNIDKANVAFIVGGSDYQPLQGKLLHCNMIFLFSPIKLEETGLEQLLAAISNSGFEFSPYSRPLLPSVKYVIGPEGYGIIVGKAIMVKGNLPSNLDDDSLKAYNFPARAYRLKESEIIFGIYELIHKEDLDKVNSMLEKVRPSGIKIEFAQNGKFLLAVLIEEANETKAQENTNALLKAFSEATEKTDASKFDSGAKEPILESGQTSISQQGDPIDVVPQALQHPYFPIIKGSTWTYTIGQRHINIGEMPGTTYKTEVKDIRSDGTRIIAELVQHYEPPNAQDVQLECIFTSEGQLPLTRMVSMSGETVMQNVSGIYLPRDLQPGQRWSWGYSINNPGGTAGGMDYRATALVIGFEKVTVAAGTFDAIHIKERIETIMRGSATATSEELIRPNIQINENYYAQNIGLVKSSSTSMEGYESYVELVDYKREHKRQQRTLEMFKAIKKGMTYAQVKEIVGEPDRDIGSGLFIFEYDLSDGGCVLIAFVGLEAPLFYIHHGLPDGSWEDMLTGEILEKKQKPHL